MKLILWQIAAFSLLTGILIGQDADSTAQVEIPPGDGLNEPIPTFYSPPDLAGPWESARAAIRAANAEQLTADYVISLLDSLQGEVTNGTDSLLIRARAFERDDRGYTRKFYRARVTRNSILSEPIPKNIAAKIPHFSVIYDPQGHLQRVRYIEPQVWLQRQKKLATRSLQPTSVEPPLVRYFKTFDLPSLNGGAYLKKKKMNEEQAHYRVVYDSENAVQRAQSITASGQIAWVIEWAGDSTGGEEYATLRFAKTKSPSLLMLDSQVFLAERSIVRSDWTAAVTRDESGNLTSVQVFNQLKQLSYHYTFKLEKGENSREQTLRAELHGADGTVERGYALAYDKSGRLINRSFFDGEGTVLSSSDFNYRPKHGFIQITTRNTDGVIIDRKSVPYQSSRD